MNHLRAIALPMFFMASAFIFSGCTRDEGITQEITPLVDTLISATEMRSITTTPQPTQNLVPTATISNEIRLQPEKASTIRPLLSSAILRSIAPGEYLVYASKLGLEISPVSGKTHQLLAAIGDDWTTISPDKQYLAYSIRGTPFVYDIKNNQEIKMMPSDAACNMPDWSPDNLKVVFTCNFDIADGSDLIVFNISDFSQKKITNCTATKDFCEMPKWSPQGDKIAYTRSPAYSGGSPTQGLYILDLGCSGNDKCELGSGPYRFINAYAWSPDGSKLAGIINEELFMYRYDKGKLSAIGSFGRTGTATTIVWSPDSKFLAFGPIDDKPFKYSIDKRQIEPLELPDDSRLRGWIQFP